MYFFSFFHELFFANVCYHLPFMKEQLTTQKIFEHAWFFPQHAKKIQNYNVLISSLNFLFLTNKSPA